MKKLKYTLIALLVLCMTGCNESSFLEEDPRASLYPENLLVDYSGFQSMVTSLYGMMRNEYRRADALGGGLPLVLHSAWGCGVDNSWSNNSHSDFKYMYYPSQINQTDLRIFQNIFQWCYRIINTANMVISRAEGSGIDWKGTETEAAAHKNKIIAQARFFRAWAYRHLTYSFGAVPLSPEEITGMNYRNDWERNSVESIREVMEQDFAFAMNNLPLREESNSKISGAMARHYLGELYNGGKGAGRCVPSRGAFRLYNYKDQGTQDDRVSDYAVVWTINEKGADGKITEFLNNGKMVVDTTVTAAMLDDNKTTIKKYNWPTTRKWDYVAPLLANGDKDGCYQDIVYLRLADTYLLYAEALLKNNQAGEAIKWINKVRNRSNAVSITEAELTAGGMDFILDERSRELLSEEERRHTLIRVSQEKGGDERDVNNYFKRRMRQLNEIAGRDARGMNSYDTPVLFPIPQEFIDSNTGRQLENNPGYL